MPESYFRIERPEEQTLPVVVDVPHAGEWIPDDVRDEMVVGRRVLKRDLDLYVDQMWQDAPALGATLIASEVSRYVVDLNRAPDDVSPETVEGGKRINRPGYYQDRGVVWRNTTSGVPVMAAPMSKKAFKQRLDTFYHPYHKALAKEIQRVRKQFGYCILVDGHSMPSKGRRGHTDPGSRRADIVPGNANGTSCDVTVTWTVEEHFRDHSFSVKTNQPYKGGFITRNYGRPGEDIHAIQIEVNRDLYMNERTFAIDHAGIERLREACRALLPKLADMDVK
ncbi:N-formylglutamate amidohydrolase [Persicimonas caeni]|uniref:N-formylglutamate amidohydrolase n=1 Tax=Persicimonas caeni TaxID=2292766 RepID=A0A4Y6PRI5_PERCE|nr:N-formylglutamate amidohydrolase [Persicimonas caeni]QDG50850.1 N-formylglutamate amidohydrolase [Persicimonas caeni]QED32071.1 N-formylglutamate amidohydrolase [Persicimonas caeni]